MDTDSGSVSSRVHPRQRGCSVNTTSPRLQSPKAQAMAGRPNPPLRMGGKLQARNDNKKRNAGSSLSCLLGGWGNCRRYCYACLKSSAKNSPIWVPPSPLARVTVSRPCLFRVLVIVAGAVILIPLAPFTLSTGFCFGSTLLPT